MNQPIEIKFRKERKGPEAELVRSFLKTCSETFSYPNLEITTFIEPYAEVGIPDIVLVFWDRSLWREWTHERSILTKDDIKIVHHISTYGIRGVTISNISKKLGFTGLLLEKSLDRLVNADLIIKHKNKALIRDLNESFLIRKIITIEAKVTDWRTAVNQAKLNENFSSHSYIMLPSEKINEMVLKSLDGKVGLIAQRDSKTIFKKKAKKTKIPGSYFSWVINEYLGKMHSKNLSAVN